MVEIDEMTLKRALTGDRHSFASLYHHYAPFLWKVLYSMCGRDHLLAREFMQDVFVKVHLAGRQFRGKSSFSTWLYRIAYTTAIAHFRKQQHNLQRTAFSVESFESCETADTYDVKEIADRILASLSVEERFLLTAREFDAVSFDELAEITGRTAGALRTELSRLKERIRSSFPMDSTILQGVTYA